MHAFEAAEEPERPAMNEAHNPETLRDFLLDRLPAAEIDALEQRLVEDQEFFATLKEAEDDLIDEFIFGDLTPDETRRFLELCGARIEMPARIAARRAFFAALQNITTERKALRPAAPPLAWLAIPLLALTCAMLAVIGMLWHINRDLNRKVTGLHTEKTVEQTAVAPMAPALSQANHIATVFFPLDATRGTVGETPLRLRLDTESLVALEVATPPELPGPWVITIADARGARTAQSGIKTLHIASLSFVRIYLDPSTLHPGICDVTLSWEHDSRVIQSWKLLVSR